MMGSLDFTAAARLYAENAAVVEEMKKAFLESAQTFITAATEAASALVTPAKLRHYTTQTYAYWWLSDDAAAHRDAFAQLWGRWDAPQIIVPGKIELWAAVPPARDEQLPRLLEVGRLPELAAWCKPASGTKWYLLTVEVSYRDATEGIPKVAEAIAAVLSALTKAYEMRE